MTRHGMACLGSGGRVRIRCVRSDGFKGKCSVCLVSMGETFGEQRLEGEVETRATAGILEGSEENARVAR